VNDAANSTVWFSAAVLAAKMSWPLYAAVSEWTPAVRSDRVKAAVAIWPAGVSVAVPRVVVPSRKVTVPVGTPLPKGFVPTTTVNVTAWPTVEGLTLEFMKRV